MTHGPGIRVHGSSTRTNESRVSGTSELRHVTKAQILRSLLRRSPVLRRSQGAPRAPRRFRDAPQAPRAGCDLLPTSGTPPHTRPVAARPAKRAPIMAEFGRNCHAQDHKITCVLVRLDVAVGPCRMRHRSRLDPSAGNPAARCVLSTLDLASPDRLSVVDPAKRLRDEVPHVCCVDRPERPTPNAPQT
jgi:hypothetical protein